jgi:hypothetical protein
LAVLALQMIQNREAKEGR